MIASVEKGFVLLSNPKTGTTALEEAFGRHADILTGREPRWKHLNFDRMTAVFGDYFQRRGCTIYGVARHPVDTLVSWYRYRSRADLRKRQPGRYTGDIAFSQFVEEWASAAPPERARVPVSVRWCLTGGGLPAPMTFYRYENLPQLHEVLCRHVGREVRLERRNASPPRPIDLEPAEVAAEPRMRRLIALYEKIPFVVAAADPAAGPVAATRAKAARSRS